MNSITQRKPNPNYTSGIIDNAVEQCQHQFTITTLTLYKCSGEPTPMPVVFQKKQLMPWLNFHHCEIRKANQYLDNHCAHCLILIISPSNS